MTKSFGVFLDKPNNMDGSNNLKPSSIHSEECKRYHYGTNNMNPDNHFAPLEERNNLLQSSNASSRDDSFLETAVWFYPKLYEPNIPITIVNEFAKLGVNVIYFGGTTVADWKNPITLKKYSEFVCYAYSKQIKVYPVTLEDPSFAFADSNTLKDEFLKFLLQTKDLFDTYVVDVEPHVQHLSDYAVYLPKYIRMSQDLQEIAEQYNVTYVDTVPYWYHHLIKNLGISQGLNILGGAAVNVMDYSYSSNRSIDNIRDIVKDVKKPYTVSIKITPGFGDPYLNEKEMQETVNFLKDRSISYGIFESQYLLRNYLQMYR
jgi:hypothetical protein